MYMLNAISLPNGLSLRCADERDHVFMARVFGSTREYLYHMDLPIPYVDALVKQQFTLQCDSYRRQFPHANSFVIHCMAQAIGRVIVEESASSLLIVDLTLLPESCGKGYGTAILQALKAVAETQQCDLKLSVDRQNWRAKKRYAALGFNVVAETDTHESMVWWPPLLAATAVE
jgi:GNAT superfamily N-acetyltransferase